MPHVISTRVNLTVLATLIALALVTWGVAYVDLRRWNLVVAMAIAMGKVLLVVLIFMHGWYMPRLSKLAFFTGAFLLAILIFLTLSDYLSRSLFPPTDFVPAEVSMAAPQTAPGSARAAGMAQPGSHKPVTPAGNTAPNDDKIRAAVPS